MSIVRSLALVNALAKGFGAWELLRDGRLYIYTGNQPANAEAAPSGTNLLIFTKQGLAYTSPTRSLATIAIGGAATGALETIKLGGMDFNLLSAAVSYNTSASVTAAAIAANINARKNPFNVTAEQSGDNVLLYLPYWLGASGDDLTFATTVSGSLTATASGTFGGGVTAANGLNFLEAIASGVASKESSIWQGTGLATGNMGWFRFVAGGSTVDGVSGNDIRFDGTIATSGGDMTTGALGVEANAIYTITAGTITQPVS